MKKLLHIFIFQICFTIVVIGQVTMNANRIIAKYHSDGIMESDSRNSLGLRYPGRVAGAIYSSGLLWGCLSNDGAMLNSQPRVNGQKYRSGTSPGRIVGTRTGIVDSVQGRLNQIWKVRRDFATANLFDEVNDHFVDIMSAPVTKEDIYNFYLQDWKSWPAGIGAPFYDADSNGKYEPKFIMKDGKEIPVLYPQADEPGYGGADQVIWYVMNDIANGESPWFSKPLGLEIQTTIFAYDHSATIGTGNAVYKNFKFIYKGTSTTPDTAFLKDMYITHWIDSDLGFCCDDMVACDTLRNIGFVYNGNSHDSEYDKFGIPPPSIGYMLLQGPVIPSVNDVARVGFSQKVGFKNLQMTSFYRTLTGDAYADPPYSLLGSLNYYCLFQGFPPYYGSACQPMIINPATQLPTKFLVSGDPIKRTGWIEEIYDYGSDKRFYLTSGPFNMALNDTQEVAYAVVGGLGSDRISSVSVMKFFASQAKEFYDNIPQYPTNTIEPEPEPIIPEYFSLEQNYPNPFNPGTTISYTFGEQIGNHRHVTLKIFDVLGREVAVLVNETKDPGTYEVTWDAKKIPSGIYYYTFRVGSFVQTRKMMLLK